MQNNMTSAAGISPSIGVHIFAGHKTDTVCVGHPGMCSYHLCLQEIAHDLVVAWSRVFARPQNKIFLILLGGLEDELSAAVTDKTQGCLSRKILGGKKSITLCRQSAASFTLLPFQIFFSACFVVFTDMIYI